jgi:hypothetical protein
MTAVLRRNWGNFTKKYEIPPKCHVFWPVSAQIVAGNDMQRRSALACM